MNLGKAGRQDVVIGGYFQATKSRKKLHTKTIEYTRIQKRSTQATLPPKQGVGATNSQLPFCEPARHIAHACFLSELQFSHY